MDKALIEKCQNVLNQSKVYVFEKYEYLVKKKKKSKENQAIF